MSPFALVRPLVFALDPERAHRLMVSALKLLPARDGPTPDPALSVALAGLTFPTPVGLAAGFDKDAEVPDGTGMCVGPGPSASLADSMPNGLANPPAPLH